MNSGLTYFEELAQEQADKQAAFLRAWNDRQKENDSDDYDAEAAGRLEELTRPRPNPPSNVVAGLPQNGPVRGRDLPTRVATPKIEFRVSEDEHAALKVIAQAEGKSVASFARDAVRAYIHSR